MRSFLRFVLLTCAGLALVAPLPASAASKNFIAVLNGGQEVPPSTTSTSVGTGFFTLDTVTGMVCYAISYTALTSAETDAHIHGPDAPFTEHPMNIILSLLPPLGSPRQGCIGPLTGPQMGDMKKGLYYVNIHSMNFPLGEIRGQLTPVKGK